MPHYKCPECKRNYFSNVDKNATCKYCPANWRLSGAGVKPSESIVLDKLSPKIGQVIIPNNPFELFQRYERPALKLNLRRTKPKLSKDEIDVESALFSRPKRDVDFKFTSDQLNAFVDNSQANLDDTDWEPPARTFNISMRLTPSTGPRMASRDPKTVTVNPAYQKPMTQLVAGAAGRKSTNAVMGAFICGKGTISASKVSGGPKFQFKQDHDEWCHLVGDALGGLTTSVNLVAGSYGANTHMAVLEKLLQGKTAIELKVIAHCNKEHVAEFIYFEPTLVSNKTKSIQFVIDAKNRYFTSDDQKDQQQILTTWMKSVGQA